MADPLHTVASYWSLEDYAVQRTALDAAGIANFADDHFIIHINWLNANAMHGIKLRVAEEDADGARDVLAGASEIGEPEAWVEPAPEHGCPNCAAESVERSQRPWHVVALGVTATAAIIAGSNQWMAAFPMLILTALAAMATPRRTCTECGERW